MLAHGFSTSFTPKEGKFPSDPIFLLSDTNDFLFSDVGDESGVKFLKLASPTEDVVISKLCLPTLVISPTSGDSGILKWSGVLLLLLLTPFGMFAVLLRLGSDVAFGEVAMGELLLRLVFFFLFLSKVYDA